MNALCRILIVVEPGRDGVFSVVRDLVRHLHSRHPGICVDLAYSSRRQLSGSADALAADVQAHGGEAVDLGVSNAPEFRDFAAAARIRALVRRRRPQLVHCHSSKAGALCRLLAFLPGFPPVIYTPHAYYGAGRTGGSKELVYNTIERILGRVGMTVCCSSDEAAFAVDVLRVDPARVTVVNNGIDTEAFRPASPGEKLSLRTKLGIPLDGKLLVTVGRDSQQKNYAPLYAALDRMITRGCGFRFAHAGEGAVERRARLSGSARPFVHAFRHLDSPQDLVRAADGFIMTSLYEGLSLSMLEALSCGTAMILTAAPGLIVLRGMGFDAVHWLPDPAALAIEDIESAIREWMVHDAVPDLLQRERAVENFDKDRQFEKLIALYRSLA